MATDACELRRIIDVVGPAGLHQDHNINNLEKTETAGNPDISLCLSQRVVSVFEREEDGQFQIGLHDDALPTRAFDLRVASGDEPAPVPRANFVGSGFARCRRIHPPPISSERAPLQGRPVAQKSLPSSGDISTENIRDRQTQSLCRRYSLGYYFAAAVAQLAWGFCRDDQ